MALQILEDNSPRSFSEKLNQGLGQALQFGQQIYDKRVQDQKDKRQADRIKELTGMDVSDLSPEFQKLAFNQGLQNVGKKAEFEQKINTNKKIISQLEKDRGLEEGALSAYEDDPKFAEKISRPQKKTQASMSIDPEQLNIIKNIRNSDQYKEASPLEKYQILTDAGVSKENAQAESEIAAKQADLNQKVFEKSFEANKDFINETTDKYRGFETEMKPRLLQMQNIPEEELIGPTASVFLDQLGIPLGALENPSSELYEKLSQDLLKGLPETYGNRILKVEVDNFLKTIPRLTNSPDGRRMIASNLLKLGEMKEVYYKEMRRQQKLALDGNKPLAKDFQQEVFDQVKPQIDRINNEFIKLSEITSVPKNTIPFFSPSGQIEFVPVEHAQWAEKNGGRRIW